MGIKIVGTNKKAYHEYYIEDVLETGLVLQGTEVKALRDAKVNLRDSYCRIKNGELYVANMHISPYDFGNRENHDPLRERKLLAHAQEIVKLARKVDEKGLALIPTKVYFKDGRAKLEVGIGRGKKLHDKRESLKKKQDSREVERVIRQREH